MSKCVIISKNIIKKLLFLALLTASFDIVGVITLSGFNFRFSQFIFIFIFFYTFIKCIRIKKILLSKSWYWLLLFIILQAFMIIRSPHIKNAIGYFLWLIFDSLIILSTENIICTKDDFKWLMKAQLKCYEYISIFGLIQFALHIVGIDLFITQHNWIWSFVRVNGLSYEPSYYATYILMGFVQAIFFWEIGDYTLFNHKELKRMAMIITAVLILSGSRMGWLMIITWIAYRLISVTIKSIKKGSIRKKYFRIAVLLIVIFVVGFYFISNLSFETLNRIFAGLGLFGAQQHSSLGRIDGLTTCIEIFKKSPIVGYSLGGVDPMIARYIGLNYSTLNNGRAMSIIGELLVGCGVVGLIPLLAYFGSICRKLKCGQPYRNYQIALILSFIFEIMILFFNQNILREYVWTNIAVLCTCNRIFYGVKTDE